MFRLLKTFNALPYSLEGPLELTVHTPEPVIHTRTSAEKAESEFNNRKEYCTHVKNMFWESCRMGKIGLGSNCAHKAEEVFFRCMTNKG